MNNQQEEIFDPNLLHYNLCSNYRILFKELESILIKFSKLNINESIDGENMSISCINKYQDKTILYFNHFQKNEEHFFVINDKVQVISLTYNIIPIKDMKILLSIKEEELYSAYNSIYYLLSWLRQLILNN